MFQENVLYTEDMRPQVAAWCNETQTHHIESVETDENGVEHFRIVKNKGLSDEEKAQLDLMEQTSLGARLAALEDALAEMMMEEV